jgi:phage portal protein BeeE
MNAKDMALMELSQFNESRIAVLFGVPPSLSD